MAEGENFRATVITRNNLGSAILFDFGFTDTSSGVTHLDTGIACGDFQTLVQATLAASLPSGQEIRRYRFACVQGAAIGEVAYLEVDPPVVGALGGAPLPAEIAISMKRNTGHVSRRDRGRIFFGGVDTTLVNPDGNQDEVDVTNVPLIAVRDLLKTNLVTQTRTLKPVILSAAGTHTGRPVVNVAIAPVFTHRKSRRFREFG